MRGSLVLTLGEGLVFGCSFVRNMILARLLTKADFGIAATFAMIIALLEFSAKMGVGRFLVRDPHGDEPEVVATAHTVQFGVGVLSAIIIGAAAWPMAHLFGIPEQVGGVLWLAVVPLVRGVQHLDVARFARGLRFGPSALVEAIPQVVITVAAWPVAKWLGDYRAVLILLLTKALFSCVASHALAERPYAWAIQREHGARMLRFGWPLVVNGFLMFGVLHGEQFLVATFYTMADLGPYAAAVALAMAPAFFFGRAFNPVVLPVMAKVQTEPDAFRRRYRQVVSLMALVSVTCAVGLVVGGEALMRLVYGQKYRGTGIILACLAVASALRNVRIATSIAALAKGDSQNEMRSNGSRLVGLLPALAVALLQQPVWVVACTGVLGELVACWVAFIRLRRRDGVPLAVSLVPLGWVAAWVMAAAAVAWSGAHGWHAAWALAAATLMALGSGIWMVLFMPELRREAQGLGHRVRAEGWRGFLSFLKGTTLVAKSATP